MATAGASSAGNLARKDQTLLLFARLMEGGQEDEDTVKGLDELTKLLNDDLEAVQKGEESICEVIDADCVDTILCYLDMRQPDIVRSHATLTTSAYLKASGEDGSKKLQDFFHHRINRGTYDDYIVAFCVAAVMFPIVPDLTSQLFLSEGFLSSLGPLMRRKWKSRKVETACLEMLNAACLNPACREAVQKYCTEWLEEIIDQDPEEVVKAMYAANPDVSLNQGSISMRRHSEQVQNLAAVVLAKLKAVQPPPSPNSEAEPRIQPATTSIEDLTKLFTKMLLKESDHGKQNSVEGLAYASLQPKIKEDLSKNGEFLKQLVKTLEDAPPVSPLTYGALSIFANLTRYRPAQTEEQKRISELKAYANVAGRLEPDPLDDDEQVSERCKRVFEAGITPALVTHSKNGSTASLSLAVSIIYSLSVTKSIRGKLAQQGAVRLLIGAWSALPETESQARRTAAQALARILIATNPSLVFGGSRPYPQSSAIRPLVSIIPTDPAADTRDLLPTFEALMALTNLASTDDDTRNLIIRTAWSDVEEQLLSSNARVSRAAVELICNLVQSTDAVALYADFTNPKTKNRLHILLALADAEDEGTRSAAGGALATLTGYDGVIRGILNRERGIDVLLGLCSDDNEDLRHRGAFVIYNMVAAEGETGKTARATIRAAKGVEILTECAKKSNRPEVVEITVQALKALLEEA
ncbi:hypothetical protein VTK73DRAFT_6378 [Phialemonium thermophilum]|uniref:UNC-45/Cro1/She4 central domain-containing protein n=1 Tax=Phialemonium thermophilum TaxID=223376 RepID=A0ABR3XWM0_9PEZI